MIETLKVAPLPCGALTCAFCKPDYPGQLGNGYRPHLLTPDCWCCEPDLYQSRRSERCMMSVYIDELDATVVTA